MPVCEEAFGLGRAPTEPLLETVRNTWRRWHPVRLKGLDTLSTDELVARYAEAARVHGEATVTGSHPANNEADLIAPPS